MKMVLHRSCGGDPIIAHRGPPPRWTLLREEDLRSPQESRGRRGRGRRNWLLEGRPSFRRRRHRNENHDNQIDRASNGEVIGFGNYRRQSGDPLPTLGFGQPPEYYARTRYEGPLFGSQSRYEGPSFFGPQSRYEGPSLFGSQ